MKSSKARMVGITGLALLAGVMIAATPLMAGEYSFTRIETADGEDYESNSNPTTRLWSSNSVGSASATAQGNGSDLVTISARSSGQVRAVFTWQPDFPGDLPADDYVLKVKISPMAYLGFNGDTLLATEINDGFGDSPVAYVSQGAHLVSVPTHGQTEVKTPFITLISKGTVQGYENLWVGGYLSYQAETDTRSVWISSDIEPSHYNGGVNEDDMGRPQNDTRDNVRNPDGSMIVDSLTFYHPTGYGAWFGAGIFDAVAPNFTAPTYVWTLPDGSASAIFSNNNATVDLAISYVHVGGGYVSKGINLGGTATGGFATSSTFKVTVTDSDGAVGTNTYTVRWHQELEKMRHSPWADMTEGFNYDDQASNWTNLNAPITVTVQPASVGWSIAGGGLGLLAGATSLFLSGGTATIVGLALSAAGMGVSASAPEAQQFTPTFGYDMYADAITKQYNKNHGVPGTENDQNSVYPIDLADEAYGALTDSAHAAQDPYFMGYGLQGKIQIARKWTKQPWVGEKYDVHGYAGLEHYDITNEDFTPLYVHQVKNLNAN